MSRTSLLQHIRQTAAARKAGTLNATATVTPPAPGARDPRSAPVRFAPEATLDERFEALAPLEDSRRRLLSIVDDAERYEAWGRTVAPESPKSPAPRRTR